VRRAIGRLVLRLLGWRAVGEFPRSGCEKCVLIAAPHTSNWDLPFMIAFAMAFELHIAWMGKYTLFRPPFGGFMRWLGGVPVRRTTREGKVDEMAQLFAGRPRLVLAIAPEGTRFRSEHWKSGFYWIARRAGVPIVPSYLDFGTRTAGFGPPLVPSDSLRADMDHLRAVYAGKRGLFPERFGPVRLLEEDPSYSTSRSASA
jgi:1-acyl-sn-glycerol-3-phosphate acyltransferase